MTAHFITTERYIGRSGQTRADWPEGETDPHPRCVEMAEAMREVGPGCGFRDLLHRGFSTAEIVEHVEDAEAIARSRWTKQTTIRPDMVADIVAKALAPLPNAPPITRDMEETQAVLVTWSAYCQARAALTVDPWTGQRERAIRKLSAYLDRMPIFHRVRDEILKTVADKLPQVTQ